MYEKLLSEAEKEQLEIIFHPLHENIKGLYCDGIIAINNNVSTTSEKTCVLAEELGHYYTSTGDILDQSITKNRKQERQARAWAYMKLVPLVKLIAASKAGISNYPELAEYLNVTERFLTEALNYYKEKYGMCCRIGDHWICFDPLSIIEDEERKRA